MTVPIISAYAGGFLIIMQAILMVLTGLHRAKSGINLGVGDDPVMERKIRRHGNLAENAGLFVAVLALAEMTGVTTQVIMTIAIVFVVVRLFHAIALSTEAGSHGAETGKIFVLARIIGAFGTLLSFLALGAFLLLNLM
ncbi:MAPEG family protein [Parasphingorhabdus cellanae]|uniref:MAPEG family protein n=1 Tax=Parasphingorhabdus cellanae TaxID=2806553 RepID=A0ABX7T6J6_9SPHN|nr:MAPEG family protein [Parasphingorhabdus cellanae]QTD57220.1 MAPEG family protein [Parasphingorhabdus cellanae]